MRNAISLTILALLCSSCTTPQNENPQDKDRAIDMGAYAVDRPNGRNWNVEIIPRKGAVRFLRQANSLSGEEGLPTIMIQVSDNRPAKKEMLQWSEEEIADDYRNGEINNMNRAGVLPGNYELHDVKKDITTLDGKKLYTLSYKQMGGVWFGGDKICESILYMYFPSHYKETHTFYLFLISVLDKREKHAVADFAPIFPVIKSLRLK